MSRGLQRIVDKGHLRVGVLGFSFKAGTDDLRESPMIEIIERLCGKGYDLRIYDKNVQMAKLMGANRDYILNHVPHLSKLMVNDIESALNHGQTIVIGNSDWTLEPFHRGSSILRALWILLISSNLRVTLANSRAFAEPLCAAFADNTISELWSRSTAGLCSDDETIIHRGPDDEGYYLAGPLGFGFRRLSIIDLAGGHQPMSDREESVWVVFNGEIYNFPELQA